MSDIDDFGAWIVKNQALKGTPDFETVAKAFKELDAAQNPAKPQAKPEDIGIISGTTAALGRGFESFGGVYGGLKLGATHTLGNDEAAAQQMAAMKADKLKPQEKPSMTWADMERIYADKGLLSAAAELPKYATESLAQSGPEMVLPLAVGYGATATSTPVVGPFAPLVGTVAGMATYGIQQAGHFLTTQGEEKKNAEQLEVGKALTTAAATAPLGYLVDRWTAGLGSLTGKQVGKELLKRYTADEIGVGGVALGISKAAATGVGKGFFAEAPVEVVEEVAQRWQAGQDLESPEAVAAYKEAWFGAGVSGGAMKGTSTGYQTYKGFTTPDGAPAVPATPTTFTATHMTVSGIPVMHVSGDKYVDESGNELERPASAMKPIQAPTPDSQAAADQAVVDAFNMTEEERAAAPVAESAPATTPVVEPKTAVATPVAAKAEVFTVEDPVAKAGIHKEFDTLEAAEAHVDNLAANRAELIAEHQSNVDATNADIATLQKGLDTEVAKGNYGTPQFLTHENNINNEIGALTTKAVQEQALIDNLSQPVQIVSPTNAIVEVKDVQATPIAPTPITPAVAPLQAVTEPVTKTAYAPDLAGKMATLQKTLLPTLEKFGLKHVGLRIVDSIANGQADASYVNQIMKIAYDTKDHMGALRHESIHALKELGAFADNEWKVLSNKAKTEWIDRFIRQPNLYTGYQEQYEANNGSLDGFDAYMQEEAIAEAFRHFAKTKPPAGLVGQLYNRLNKMFESVGNSFKSLGYTNADDIFQKIERGEAKPKKVEKVAEKPVKVKKAAEAKKVVEKAPEVEKAPAPKIEKAPKALKAPEVAEKVVEKVAEKAPEVKAPVKVKKSELEAIWNEYRHTALPFSSLSKEDVQVLARVKDKDGEVIDRAVQKIYKGIDKAPTKAESYAEENKAIADAENATEVLTDEEPAVKQSTPLSVVASLITKEDTALLEQIDVTPEEIADKAMEILGEAKKVQNVRANAWAKQFGALAAQAQALLRRIMNGMMSVVVGINLSVAPPAIQPNTSIYTYTTPIHVANFKGAERTVGVERLLSAILDTNTNEGKAFVVADKPTATMYVFDKLGNLKGSSPVLLGVTKGDKNMKMAMSAVEGNPVFKITPSGIYNMTALKHDTYKKEYGYEWFIKLNETEAKDGSAVGIHGAYVHIKSEKRLERLASKSIEDNRASFGCLNAPVQFMRDVIKPTFEKENGKVFITPEEMGSDAMLGLPAAKTKTVKKLTQSLETESGRLQTSKQEDILATEDSGVKYKLREERTQPVIRTEKFRRWFGKSEIVNKDGTPKVMYHGTARDITEFRAKQAGAIFLTDDPDFAEDFAEASEQYMVDEALHYMDMNHMSKAEQDILLKKAKAISKKEGTDYEDELRELIMDSLPSTANIMPVYVSAQNVFDYENPAHLDALQEAGISTNALIAKVTMKRISAGSWSTIETRVVQAAIKKSGFDGFYVSEGGKKNLAVYTSNQIKSAIGNNGEFDINNPDIRYQLRSPKEIAERNQPSYNKNLRRGEVLRPSKNEIALREKVQEAKGRENTEWHKAKDITLQNAEDSMPEETKAFIKDMPKDAYRRYLTSTLFQGDKHLYNVETSPIWKGYRDAAKHTIDLEQQVRDMVYSRMGEPAYEEMQINRKQTQSSNFKAYFNGSKVVNKNGQALIAFHATSKDFSVFNVGNQGDAKFSNPNYTGKLGSWFTAPSLYNEGGEYEKGNAENAISFSEGKEGDNIMPVYLSIKNPMEYEGFEHLSEDMSEFPSIAKYKQSLIDQGYDGIVVRNSMTDGNVDRDDWVAFKDTQIKSALGNNGEFGINNPDTRYKLREDGEFVGPTTKLDAFIHMFSDSMVDLKRVQQAVTKRGNELMGKFNAYVKEGLYTSRVAERISVFGHDEINPFIAKLDAAKISMKEMGDYLVARHAKEANIQIAKVNPDPNAHAGMTDAEADAHMAAIPPARRAVFESLAKDIDGITKENERLMVEYGLEKQSTIDAWNKVYKHYIPTSREAATSGTISSGKSLSIKGSTTRRRAGSTKRVTNVVANVFLQREGVIARGEKNRVGQSLLGLVLTNPSPDFWVAVNPNVSNDYLEQELIAMGISPDAALNLGTAPYTQRVNPDTNLVEYRINSNWKNQPNVFITRVKGEDRVIIFNMEDPRAARMAATLKNLSTEQQSQVVAMLGTGEQYWQNTVKGYRQGTRWIASVNTQYNPGFGLYNLLRDMGGATLNLQSTVLKGMEKQVIFGGLTALKAIYKDMRMHRSGKLTKAEYEASQSEWGKVLAEFAMEGGKAGFSDLLHDAEDRSNALQKELENLGKKGTFKSSKKAIFGWLSDFNSSIENCIRVSAYKYAKEHALANGKTEEDARQEAAWMAKNLTVNFSKTGTKTKQFALLYAFFNASVQGSVRIAETLMENGRLSRAGKKIIGGSMLLGVMQAVMLAMAGFEDDEPPAWEQDKSLCIPYGNGRYLPIPMPLGYNIFPSFARRITQFAMSDDKNLGKASLGMAGMIIDGFNPFGSGTFAQTLSPTLFDPIVALAENKDFTSSPISIEDLNSLDPTPGYSRAKANASAISVGLAYAVNLMSGGTEDTRGYFSPTGDAIDYLYGQATGGVGREAMKIGKTVSSFVTGEELASHNVPFVGRLLGNTKQKTAQMSKFYDTIKHLNEHQRALAGMEDREEDARYDKYLKDHPEADMAADGDKAYNQIKKLHKEKKEITKHGNLDKDDKDDIKAIDESILEIMVDFNQEIKDFKKESRK